jgi:DHA3 family macrolide efflux protein-like MFS transporter
MIKYKIRESFPMTGDDLMDENWKRKIVLFLTSQAISLFGSALVQYAISWHITLTTQSGIMMTISIICGFLPNVFLSPFSGVWADRYNRKKLIILSDSIIAVSTLIIAILFLMGYDALWLLFAVSVVRSIGTSIQAPAVGAFVPQLVPEGELTKVNAANSSIQSMITLIAPMLSGALLAVAPMEAIFFIDVVTAGIAVFILLLFLKVPVHAKAMEQQTTSYFSDMRAGYMYINNHAFVKKIFLFCAVFFLSAAPVAFLTPLQVTRSFGREVWRLTAIEIAFSGGMIIGGLIIAARRLFKNKIHTMVMSTVVMGLGTLTLGVVSGFWVYLFFMAVIGLVMPAFNTPFTVLLQQKVEADFLGRVFGVLGMISSIMMPMGMLVFGPLSDIIQIEYLLIGTGIMMVVVGLIMLLDKVLIEAGKST